MACAKNGGEVCLDTGDSKCKLIGSITGKVGTEAISYNCLSSAAQTTTNGIVKCAANYCKQSLTGGNFACSALTVSDPNLIGKDSSTGNCLGRISGTVSECALGDICIYSS